MRVAWPLSAGNRQEAGNQPVSDSEDAVIRETQHTHTLPPGLCPVTDLVARGPGCGHLCLMSVDVNPDRRSQSGLAASSEGGGRCLMSLCILGLLIE